MKNQIGELCRWLIIISVITTGAVISNCTGHEKNHPENQSRSLPDRSSTSSPNTVAPDNRSQAELLALVKRFAEGEQADDEWRKLQSYPREPLIESLLSLQKSVPEDDLLHYSIAYALASLNYQYADNVKVLTRSLTPKPNESADDVAMMLARLIRAGDKNLLPVLFSSAPASDAALAEALQDIFAQQVQAEPKEFLTQLVKQPKDTRLKVYQMTANSGLSERDVNELRKQLTALSHDPAVSHVATEILSSLIFKR